MSKENLGISSSYAYGFQDGHKPLYRTPAGISEAVVKEISAIKSEPEWMTALRLRALNIFNSKPLPTWGADLSAIDFDAITYYIRPTDRKARSWSDVPSEIKRTFERIGVPAAEQKFFAGAAAQYDSEVVYHSLKRSLERQGVIFTDMDSGLRNYPELVREFFGKVVPAGDNKFAALNSACWSGGSFIYVPPGLKLAVPLQAYFRINAELFGQFERTLIIADEGSEVHYVEGCTAPIYSRDSLHAAVVEIIAKPYARVRYTTIQNWSKNVYNLVTKRARAEEGAFVEWVDCNLGSKVTMKYPSVYLVGRGSSADTLSVALAGSGQHQDAGAKMVHLAPDTRSHVLSKSVAFGQGRTSYRGLAEVARGASGSRLSVRCDALLLGNQARADTYPRLCLGEHSSRLEHEATVSRIGEKELFYIRSRGFSELEAASLLVSGFFEPLVKSLPVDYAVEMNRLIQLEMEGSVG